MVLERGHDLVTVTYRRRMYSYLDTKEVIPPFDEMTSEVPRGLPYDLHPNIVPRHPGNPAPIIHILLGSIQSVEVPNSRVAIILAWCARCLIRWYISPKSLLTDPAKYFR